MPAHSHTPHHTDNWPREAAATWAKSSESASNSTNPAAYAAAEKRKARELRLARRAANPPDVAGHELLRIIGSGAYGEVWLARAHSGEYRAIKVVWREDFSSSEFYDQELAGNRFYEPLSSNNYGLMPLLEVVQREDYFYCVMALADDTDSRGISDPETYCPRTLRDAMSRYGCRPIPLDTVIGVGVHIAHGLARLHEAGLTHGDIKPSNIVYLKGQPCLADAGMVSPPGQRTCSGTEGYIPPEGPGSKQADVYALAMVLYEMATDCDRHDFPTLPVGLPEGNERWLAFNRLICAAGDPTPARRRITSATQMGRRLEELRHPPVFARRAALKARLLSLGLAVAVVLVALLAAFLLLPEGFTDRLPRAWEVLMGPRR